MPLKTVALKPEHLCTLKWSHQNGSDNAKLQQQKNNVSMHRCVDIAAQRSRSSSPPGAELGDLDVGDPLLPLGGALDGAQEVVVVHHDMDPSVKQQAHYLQALRLVHPEIRHGQHNAAGRASEKAQVRNVHPADLTVLLEGIHLWWKTCRKLSGRALRTSNSVSRSS